MPYLATTTTVANVHQAVQLGPVTKFHWNDEDNAARLSCVDNKTSFKIGERFAWHPTDYFEEHIWRNFLLPKLENVFNKNQKNIFGSRSKPFAEIKCYMTSASRVWTTSRPTVVASSTKPRIAQKIVSVFTQNPIISRLNTGFDFYADPDAADSIITATTTELDPPVFGASISTLCGIRILVAPEPGNNTSTWKHATLGGLLQIDDAIYGITAAHVFADKAKTEDDSTEDGQSERSETSQASAVGRVSQAASISSVENWTVYLDATRDTRITDDGERHEQHRSVDSAGGSSTTVLGQLHHPDSGPWSNASKDWALVKIEDSSYHLPNTVEVDGRTLQCSDIATSIPSGTVAVAAGFGGIDIADSSGRTRGVLLPEAPDMISMFTIDRSSCKFSRQAVIF